ncbi:MAG: DUF933 domain-containing protein [Planctomycetaceae bacterium]|nr:DUF933 domain-containing protein [Planctomycetaceae bacterium]
MCAKLEAEIAELDEADRAEMLAGAGLAEPALAVLARAAYKTLGLQSYFTAGEKEVRAWTVPVGALAPQAAGVIHTDFEKGFIRAEIYSLEDLEHYKSEKEMGHPWPRQAWPGVVAAKVRPAGRAVAPPGDRGRRGAAAL